MGLPNSYSLLALCLIGMGTQVLAAERQHKITNQDFFEIANMGQVVLSPDAKMAAWLESRWDKNLDKAQKDIWLVDSKSRQSKRLTFSNESESAISWSLMANISTFSAAAAMPSSRRPSTPNHKFIVSLSKVVKLFPLPKRPVASRVTS